MNGHPKIPRTTLLPKIHLGVFALLSLFHLWLVTVNHYQFRTFAFDYGVYNFAFFDFAHLRASPCPVYHSPYPVSFLQDHLSFTILFLSPLYWIFSSVTGSFTLLIFQWLCICAGGWYTYRLIRMKSDDPWLGTAAMVTYFVIFGRFAAYQADCNLAIIGGALLPLLAYFYQAGRYLPLSLLFIFLSFNREDVPLVLIFLFLFLALTTKEPRKKFIALGFSGLSVILFVLFFSLLIPGLEDENKKFSLFNYSSLGETPVDALQTAVLHPFETVRLLFVSPSANEQYDWTKFSFYLVYFLSGGFILLLRPLYFLPLIPILAKKMLNEDPMRWGYDSYHGIELVSLLPLLAFSVICDLRNDRVKKGAGIGVLAATVLVSVFCLSHSENIPGINKTNFLSGSFYKGDVTDVGKVNMVLRRIPPGAPVSASARVLPHLAFREKIYYFPKISDAEYVCLLLRNNAYPLTQPQFDAEISKLQHSGEWSALASTPDVLLLKRVEKFPIDSITSTSQIP